jgi:hypothetical protein
MQINRSTLSLCEGSNGMSELTKVSVAISRLNTVKRSAKLRAILDRLRQHLDLSTETQDLRLVSTRYRGECLESLLPGGSKSRPRTHAERFVEHN